MSLIRFVILATLFGAGAPGLPGMELLTGHKTELPVEVSEGKEESAKIAGTRQRKHRVKADIRCARGHAAHELRSSLPSGPGSARPRAGHTLPNGLTAPLIC